MLPLASLPFLSPSLTRGTAQATVDLRRATTELATSRKADTGKAVEGDHSRLIAMAQSIARGRAQSGVAEALAHKAGNIQAALDHVASLTKDLSVSLASAVTPGLMVGYEPLITSGGLMFQQVISTLNTRISDQSLFAGATVGAATLPDGDAFLAALQQATAHAGDAATLHQAVQDWFADPSGYAALYGGSDPAGAVGIATDEAIGLNVTALTPEVRAVLAAGASLALLDAGRFAGEDGERMALARLSAADMASAARGMVDLQARIGTSEARLELAAKRNEAEVTRLETARNALLEADPYTTSVQVKELEARVELLQLLTARLSALSLGNYLR